MWRTVKGFWPYLWPEDRADLRRRILMATGLLVAAKLVTIAVPYTFKWATDAVAPAALAEIDHSFLLIGIPFALTLLYGFSRVLMALLTQVRDALFAAVAMHSVRRLANETFEHMHRLSLRFHLERKTGGLTRVLDRGRAGIESIVRMTMLTLAPTIVEFVMILAVLLYEFDWRYALVTIFMIIGYMLFTTKATEWRMNIRRSMNDSDTDASGKAVDSLLNFETVKYFGASRARRRVMTRLWKNSRRLASKPMSLLRY